MIVQVPLSCQPLLEPLAPAAKPYTFLVSWKFTVLKLIETGSVRLLPEVVTAPPLLMVHWLFATTPAPPGVTVPFTYPFPASLTKTMLLLPRLYWTQHAPAGLRVALNSRWTVLTSAFPA